MTLTLSPGEKKAVLHEIQQGGEGDTDEEAQADLVKRAVHAFLDVREQRDVFAVMTFQATKAPQVPLVHGQFSTMSSAQKGLEKIRGIHGDRAVIVRLLPRPRAEEAE